MIVPLRHLKLFIHSSYYPSYSISKITHFVQQIRLKDFANFVELLWSEKGISILKNLATSRSSKRLVVLTATTLLLLYFRLQIMGSQLPVFTKQVLIYM